MFDKLLSNEARQEIKKRVLKCSPPGGMVQVFDKTTGTLFTIVVQKTLHQKPKALTWSMHGPLSPDQATEMMSHSDLVTSEPVWQ